MCIHEIRAVTELEVVRTLLSRIDWRNILVLPGIAFAPLPVEVSVRFIAGFLRRFHRDVRATHRDIFVILWIRRDFALV